MIKKWISTWHWLRHHGSPNWEFRDFIKKNYSKNDILIIFVEKLDV